MSELAQIISTVGFPIVSFLIASYFIKYTYQKLMIFLWIKTAESNKDAMSKIGNLAEAVNNNTSVLVNLTEEIRDLTHNKEDGKNE